MDYGRLIADHERIEGLCARLAALSDPVNPDVALALALRDSLASELRQHLSHEDSFLYARAIDGRSNKFSDLAQSFISEFAVLVEDWGTYLDEWSSESIEADWVTFCADTRALLARMQRRVERENTIIYPAALQAGLVTLHP